MEYIQQVGYSIRVNQHRINAYNNHSDILQDHQFTPIVIIDI